MNKKVLVVGGSGYIGGYTTDYLINKGYEVGVYDNLTYENRYLKNVKFYYGDIRDTNRLLSVSEEYDTIVFLAALVVPACSVDPELAHDINYLAVKNFTDKIPVNKHTISMSTCSVYGAQSELLDEFSEPKPLSTYASTKLMSEKCIERLGGTVFRLGTVYGVGDAYSRIRLDLVVNVLAMKCTYEKKFTIFGGDQWRPLICVRDIAGYIEESIRRNIRGTYILSEGNYTMKDIGDIMMKIFPDVEMIQTDIPVEDARNYRVNNDKSNHTFEYYPIYNIRTEVLRMKRIFEDHRITNVNDDIYNNGKLIKLKYGKV